MAKHGREIANPLRLMIRPERGGPSERLWEKGIRSVYFVQERGLDLHEMLHKSYSQHSAEHFDFQKCGQRWKTKMDMVDQSLEPEEF
ncbi:hypothetical protein E4U59_007039 [Claviceps monticola]|nr:hypothetical protein E4U59_007039 [Claviceps monticola]